MNRPVAIIGGLVALYGGFVLLPVVIDPVYLLKTQEGFNAILGGCFIIALGVICIVASEVMFQDGR